MKPNTTYFLTICLLLFGVVLRAQKPLPNTIPPKVDYIDSPHVYLPFTGDVDDLKQNQKKWLIEAYRAYASKIETEQPDSALHLVQYGLLLAQKFNFTGPLSNLHFQLGNYYKARSEYHKAIQNFYLGLKYTEEEDLTLNNGGYPNISIGNLFYELKRFNRAKYFFKRAYERFSLAEYNVDDAWGQAVALNNIALCALAENQPDSAVFFFNKALNIREKLVANHNVDSILLLHSYLYLARAYRLNGDLVKAQKFLAKAQLYENTINKSNANPVLIAQVAFQNAEFLLSSGKYEEAIKTTKKAFILGQSSIFTITHNIYVHKCIAKAYHKFGKAKKAEASLNKAIELATDIDNLQLLVELLNLKLNYLIEQKRFLEIEATNQKLRQYSKGLQTKQEEALSVLFDFNLELAEAQATNQNLKYKNQIARQDAASNKRNIILLLCFVTVLLILSVLLLQQYRKVVMAKTVEKNTHERINKLVNSIENTIICLNLSGKIVLINKACIQFYKQVIGVTLKEGDNFFSALTEDAHKELWHSIMVKAKELKKPWVEEREVSTNTPIYLQQTLTPTFDASHNVNGIVVVATDITEAKLQEQLLLEQKEKLDNSDAAKQQMLNLLAHDLKDIVYSAQNLAQLVIDDPSQYDKETLVEFFALLNTNFSKNKLMMESLLAWAKTQVGGIKANIAPVDVANFIHETVELMSARAAEKDISISTSVDENLIVKADYDMLKAVLRNLVSNAIKFTPTGTGKIVISAKPVGDSIKICVKDNGIGLSDNQLKKVLERPGSTHTKGTAGELGSGFGLSICQGYLELNQSTLEIHTEKDQGSTFCFSLPKA